MPTSRGVRTELADYRPETPRGITALTMRLQGGASAEAFHLGNLGIHLLNGVLLAAILPATLLGFAATGLFLLHPMQSEAVSYLSARADLLLVTAMLLTVLASRVSSRAVSGVLMALGLVACWGAKETGIVGIGLLGLWLMMQRKPSPVWLLLSATVVGLLGTWNFLGGLHTWTAPSAPTYRFLAVQSGSIVRLWSLLIPWGLTVDHDWSRLPQSLGLVAFCGLIATGVMAWQHRHGSPRVCFVMLWSLIAFLPRLCVPVPHALAEHHLYLPALGLWLTPALERIA